MLEKTRKTGFEPKRSVGVVGVEPNRGQSAGLYMTLKQVTLVTMISCSLVLHIKGQRLIVLIRTFLGRW